MSGPEKPIPTPSVETRPYWSNLRERRLTLPKCNACGHFWFPPSVLCPNCHSDDYSWADASGRGTVFSYVVFHRVYHPGFADEVPYVVAIIELEEGPRILSNVVGIEPDCVFCEMPVQVQYVDISSETTIPKFIPV
jgi:uncharacterized OB-fold protein